MSELEPGAKPGKAVRTIAALLTVAGLLGIVGVSIWIGVGVHAINDSVKTSGEVIERHQVDGDAAVIEVRYRADGEFHIFRPTGAIKPAPNVGEQVEVSYRAHDPANVRIAGPTNWVGPIIAMVLSVLGLAFGLVFAAIAVKERRTVGA